MTDFGRMKNYANYIKDNPFRRGLHFPAAEAALGNLNNKRILDIGCGDGLFPRLLAQRGASVVGYDKAPEKIAEAGVHEDARQNLPCSNVDHGATVRELARGAGSLFLLCIAPPRLRRKVYLRRPQSFVLGFWTRLPGAAVHQAGR
jgi:SAM-dependent methyltransferase